MSKIIILFSFFTIVSANEKCSSESLPRVPKYHLIEKCHRSKLGIAAKANYTSLTSCRRLGIEKKALALNFSPPDAEKIKENEPMDYTCEVLKCAESDGGLSLANDTRYDYYSIYGNPIPITATFRDRAVIARDCNRNLTYLSADVNSTCVPATGMFYLLSKKMNFTQAQTECKNISAVLADVTSEQRTDALAAVLAGASVDAALVGLKRTNSSTFSAANGDALDCTTYRAWSPGHPRKYYDKFDCMVITRHRTWRSVPCKKRYPVLCELVPGGPYKVGTIFRKKNESDIESNSISSDKGEKSINKN